MSSYQGSTSVQADAKAVFGFASNPENLAKFVPCIAQADGGLGDVIHVRGTCPHGDFLGVGSLLVEADSYRMRWNSRANLNYRGWLHVTDDGESSEVTIHLEFDPGMDFGANREFSHVLKEHPRTIQETLEEALSRLKHCCESSLTTA